MDFHCSPRVIIAYCSRGRAGELYVRPPEWFAVLADDEWRRRARDELRRLDVPERPVAEYHFSPGRRRDLMWSGLLFGVIGGFCFLGGLYRLRWPVPGDETPALIFVAAMGGVIAAVCLRTLLVLSRAGRLAFFADRAELPQSLLPPWCFLAPRRLDYAAVVQWGAAEPPTSLVPVTVLVFAVAPPGGGAKRILQLTVSHYPDPAAVREEFRKRLPPPCVAEIGSVFGTVSFRELAPEPPAAPGRVPWSAEAQADNGA